MKEKLQKAIEQNGNEIYECNVEPEKATEMQYRHAVRIIDTIIEEIEDWKSKFISFVHYI